MTMLRSRLNTHLTLSILLGCCVLFALSACGVRGKLYRPEVPADPAATEQTPATAPTKPTGKPADPTLPPRPRVTKEDELENLRQYPTM